MMKHTLFSLLFCAMALAAGAKAQAQQSVRVEHYDIRLDLGHQQARTLAGRTQVTVAALADVDTLTLFLAAATIDSVLVPGGATGGYLYADGRLDIPLTLQAGGRGSVEVWYHSPGYVEERNWGGFHFNSSIYYNLGVAFGEYPHSVGRAWFPCIDDFGQKSTYQFEFTSPAGWTTTASGIRDTAFLNADGSETSRWTLSRPTPTYLVSVACGPFRYIRRPMGGYPAVVAFGSQDSLAVDRAFAQLDQVVPMYERCFGPYRWGTIGYTATPQGSMEHVNNIALHQGAAASLAQAEQSNMAHELSHAWFGNLVTCATSEDMWFNEGGASFCEEVAVEAVKGRAAAEAYYRDKLEDVLLHTHRTDGGYIPLYGPAHSLTYGSTVYDKGAVVWHSLRGLLGEEVFYGAMQRLFSDLAFSNITTAQLCDSLESYTGMDLSEFFRFHVYSPGFVDYSVDQMQVEGREVALRLSHHFAGCDTCSPLERTPVPVTFFRGCHPFATRLVVGDSARFSLDQEPEFAVVDYYHALSDAVIDQDTIVYSRGSYTLDYALVKLTVGDVDGDSAYFHIAHHFCPPTAGEQLNPGIVRLASRYWTTIGHRPEGVSCQVSFSYNRSSSAMLDKDFLPTAACVDSLRLLYRPSPLHDWTPVSATRSGNNQSGTLRTSYRQGQFALAVVDESRLEVERAEAPLPLRVFPNPAHGSCTVEGGVAGTLEICDLAGRVLRRLQVGAEPASVSLSGLAPGTYLFRLSDPEKGSIYSSKVVFN